MRAFIEKIEIYPEKPKDGCWIKKIVFNFPVPINCGEVKELPLESETTVETVFLTKTTKHPQTEIFASEPKIFCQQVSCYLFLWFFCLICDNRLATNDGINGFL
jgi:hypothetical protein